MKTFRKKFGFHLFSAFLVCLLIVTIGGHFVDLAEANFFPISTPQPAFVIKSDGSVDPSTAPIHRDGNSYTFTDNIVDYTVAVERDNIVLDGNGYTLRGNGDSTGLLPRTDSGLAVARPVGINSRNGNTSFTEDFMNMNS